MENLKIEKIFVSAESDEAADYPAELVCTGLLRDAKRFDIVLNRAPEDEEELDSFLSGEGFYTGQ